MRKRAGLLVCIAAVVLASCSTGGSQCEGGESVQGLPPPANGAVAATPTPVPVPGICGAPPQATLPTLRPTPSPTPSHTP